MSRWPCRCGHPEWSRLDECSVESAWGQAEQRPRDPLKFACDARLTAKVISVAIRWDEINPNKGAKLTRPREIYASLEGLKWSRLRPEQNEVLDS